MSIKNECAIVRDLLPLYAENMVCGETAEFVRGHLDGCASCRAELEQIGSAQSDAENRTDKNPAENDTAPLARIGKNIFKKKMYAVLMTALILSAFLVSVFGYLSSPEYLPYSPDTVTVGETADGALAVSFGENVTGYRIYEEASPDGENASVYRIEAWTSLLDRMFLHPGRQNAVIRPDDAGHTVIWFAQNGTNRNLSDDVQIYGKTENGGRISLPRLFLVLSDRGSCRARHSSVGVCRREKEPPSVRTNSEDRRTSGIVYNLSSVHHGLRYFVVLGES